MPENAATADRATSWAIDPQEQARLMGLGIFLAVVTMLFAGFTSAYIARKAAPDWRSVQLPGILLWNTLILLASSAMAEIGRRAHRRSGPARARPWLGAAWMLGILFLCGQYLAWRALARQGIYLPTTPYSSFFYVLTAVHAAHLLGGLAALTFTLARPGPPGKSPLSITYWHFVDLVWIYLYLVLLFL